MLIRRVPWTQLPLGCVVLEGPSLWHGMVGELAAYPVLTRTLRDQLWARYQLGPVPVTIVDPDPGLERLDFRGLERRARTWLAGLADLATLKDEARNELRAHPQVREGLATLGRWDEGPYTLTKDWARSVTQVVKDHEPFGASFGPPGSVAETLAALVGQTGPFPRLGRIEVDVGIDVSRSMTVSGKADFACREALSLLQPILNRWGAGTWRFWTFAEVAVPADRPRPPAGETKFAPFLRRVLEHDQPGTAHLGLLITDGRCTDRAESLRLLERFARQGIDYLQLILLYEEDLRTLVNTSHGVDGVVVDGEFDEALAYTRTVDEWEAAQADELRQVTDLAEAARGGQLVITWNPLFRLVTLDVWERYLAKGGLRPVL